MDESDRTLSEQAETICNTDILRFDPHALNLIDWTKKPVIHGSIQQSSEGHGLQDRPGVIVFTSTPDSPALLIESEADFCTILFTIDHRGTAVLLHSPFAPPSDIPDEKISFSEYADTEMVAFRDTVADTIDARQSMTVVTGMSGTTAGNILKVRDAVEQFLKSTGGPVYEVATLESTEEFWVDGIEGVMIIPKQLSKDGRNKVLLLDISHPRYSREELSRLIEDRQKNIS